MYYPYWDPADIVGLRAGKRAGRTGWAAQRGDYHSTRWASGGGRAGAGLHGRGSGGGMPPICIRWVFGWARGWVRATILPG